MAMVGFMHHGLSGHGIGMMSGYGSFGVGFVLLAVGAVCLIGVVTVLTVVVLHCLDGRRERGEQRK